MEHLQHLYDLSDKWYNSEVIIIIALIGFMIFGILWLNGISKWFNEKPAIVCGIIAVGCLLVSIVVATRTTCLGTTSDLTSKTTVATFEYLKNNVADSDITNIKFVKKHFTFTEYEIDYTKDGKDYALVFRLSQSYIDFVPSDDYKLIFGVDSKIDKNGISVDGGYYDTLIICYPSN